MKKNNNLLQNIQPGLSWKCMTIAVLGVLSFGMTASAVVNYSFVEDGGNVVLAMSGSYSDAEQTETNMADAATFSTTHWFIIGSGAGPVTFYHPESPFYGYDSTEGTMSLFAISSPDLYSGLGGVKIEPTNFEVYTDVAGGISGNATWFGETLDSIGFDSELIQAGGGYIELLDAGSNPVLRVNVSVTAVPEPQEYAMLASIVTLGVVALVRRKREQSNTIKVI